MANSLGRSTPSTPPGATPNPDPGTAPPWLRNNPGLASYAASNPQYHHLTPEEEADRRAGWDEYDNILLGRLKNPASAGPATATTPPGAGAGGAFTPTPYDPNAGAMGRTNVTTYGLRPGQDPNTLAAAREVFRYSPEVVPPGGSDPASGGDMTASGGSTAKPTTVTPRPEGGGSMATVTELGPGAVPMPNVAPGAELGPKREKGFGPLPPGSGTANPLDRPPSGSGPVPTLPVGTLPAPTVPGEPAKPATPPGSFAGLDLSGLPEPDMDFSGAAKRAGDASYAGMMALLQPEFDAENRAAEQRLANQGLPMGSEAYNTELARIARQQGAQRTNAANAAVTAGNAEAGNLFTRALQARMQKANERVAGANVGLTARGQDTSRDVSKYGTDVSAELNRRRLGLDEGSQEFNQLMQLVAGARGGVNMPNFGTPAPLDVAGAAGITSANANSQLARNAADRGLLAQLGGSVLGNIDWSSLFGQAA